MKRGCKVGVVALLLALQLACSQNPEAHEGVQEQPSEQGQTQPPASEPPKEDALDREPPVVSRAWQLPTDFPLPEEAEIRISRSHEQDGKQEVFMLFEAAEGLQATAERFAEYLHVRVDSESLDWHYDAGNAWLEIDDPVRGEAWSLIGHNLEGTDREGEEWVVNWWEL